MNAKVISFVLTIIMLTGFASCGKTYSDDTIAIAGYLNFFDRPEDVTVNRIEKWEFENEIIFYLSRDKYDEHDADEVELLLVYYPSSKETKTAFFLDMEYGMNPDIKALWDSRETKAISSHVFSDDEVASVITEVIEYCSKSK